MIQQLLQQALAYGEKLKLVPIRRLQSLKVEIDRFAGHVELNDLQRWIVNDLYTWDLPAATFPIQSIILIAIPHPAYAEVVFEKQGREYGFASLVMSDFGRTEHKLNAFLSSKMGHLVPAPGLPLKRLAVRSGLAVYGRNNICYIDGLGSFFSFVAYYSDLPCDDTCWREIRMAEMCADCQACLHSCPTGAIRESRFLIDNQRCLSYLNESDGEFPAWLPMSAHHCLYDCLKCQISCPMNKDYAGNVIGPICFSEDETNALLSGTRFESFSPALKSKSEFLGLHQWPAAIPRNLNVLFELSDANGS